MPNPHYDLAYAAAGLAALKDYLLTKELFWPLSISAAGQGQVYPKLTAGSLLLTFSRLHAYSKSSTLDAIQQSEFTRLEREFDALKRKWQVAWEEKASREFTSRLRQWSHYLNEFTQNPDAQAPYYRSEIRLRVLLELLKDDLGEVPHEDLSVLDKSLRAQFTKGDFIWDEDLAEGFPQDQYWFLYGQLSNHSQ
jgi:hypothetical protein